MRAALRCAALSALPTRMHPPACPAQYQSWACYRPRKCLLLMEKLAAAGLRPAVYDSACVEDKASGASRVVWQYDPLAEHAQLFEQGGCRRAGLQHAGRAAGAAPAAPEIAHRGLWVRRLRHRVAPLHAPRRPLLLTALGNPWSCSTHAAYPAAFKAAVRALLCADWRARKQQRAPALPAHLLQGIVAAMAAGPLSDWVPELAAEA